ncbi:MAG: hypothetical protein AAGC86_15900 [Pseudomonadota bacterium]
MGNETIGSVAGNRMARDRDHALLWADIADALIPQDPSVLDSGKPGYAHEPVQKPAGGEAMLNRCEFPGDLIGERRAFGASFTIEA